MIHRRQGLVSKWDRGAFAPPFGLGLARTDCRIAVSAGRLRTEHDAHATSVIDSEVLGADVNAVQFAVPREPTTIDAGDADELGAVPLATSPASSEVGDEPIVRVPIVRFATSVNVNVGGEQVEESRCVCHALRIQAKWNRAKELRAD